MSASAAFQTEGDEKTKTRLELDHQKRFSLGKIKISYEQQVQVSAKLIDLGNPVRREAKRRDKEAIKAEKQAQFSRMRTQLRYWEINRMDREDVHSC